MTFGFASGEASSEFIAAAGDRFYAPITMTLIPSAEIMYSLQFSVSVTNVTTTNNGAAPPVNGNFSFQSMLWKPHPLAPDIYHHYPPGHVHRRRVYESALYESARGPAWRGLARTSCGKTNLYNTEQPDPAHLFHGP